ncbi:MAG: hypothetical protein WCO08_07605 [Actinomycetes bacterium]
MTEAGKSDRVYLSARKYVVPLLNIESLILFGLVVYLIVKAILASHISAPGALIGEIFFGLLGAGGLLVCSRSFEQKQPYGQSPAVLANLIALGVSYFMFSGKLFLVAIPLALLAFTTLIASIFGYRPAPK